MAWYRNPIRDVALFLDKKHGENYRVSFNEENLHDRKNMTE